MCPPDMHPDLTRVIELQRLDSTAHDAEHRIADEPERQKAEIGGAIKLLSELRKKVLA